MAFENKFYWKADFGSSVLEQLDAEGNEVLFSEVENNMANLQTFSVISMENKNEEYTVDLGAQKISGNGININVTGNNPELIYKRRNEVRAEVGSNKIIESRKTHIIGIKTDDGEETLEIMEDIGMLNKMLYHRDKNGNAQNKTSEIVIGKPANPGSRRKNA